MQSLTRKERERQVREQEILDAAEKIFGKTGFDAATMDEIAKEAQFTRKTLYQYFGNKYELYFAVVTRGAGLLASLFQAAVPQGRNGFEKLQRMGLCYYRFYREHTALFGLMNEVGRIKHGSPGGTAQYDAQDEQLFAITAQMIGEGIADGSVRPDINPKEATYSMIFLVTGLFYELSLAGKTYTGNFALDKDRFVHNTLDFILEGFKNT